MTIAVFHCISLLYLIGVCEAVNPDRRWRQVELKRSQQEILCWVNEGRFGKGLLNKYLETRGQHTHTHAKVTNRCLNTHLCWHIPFKVNTHLSHLPQCVRGQQGGSCLSKHLTLLYMWSSHFLQRMIYAAQHVFPLLQNFNINCYSTIVLISVLGNSSLHISLNQLILYVIFRADRFISVHRL